MITAYQWYNIAQTTTINSSTGVRVEFGSNKILINASIDWANASISIQDANLSNALTASVRLRTNGIYYYLDIKVNQSFDTNYNIELYDNTFWSKSTSVSNLAGTTLCVIDDILSSSSPNTGESLWMEDENGDLVPKPKADGTPRGVWTNSFLSAGGLNPDAGEGGGGGLKEFSIIFNGTRYNSSNGVAIINGDYATIDDIDTTLQGYFTNGVAKEAAKVSNIFKIIFNGTTYEYNGSVGKEINFSDLNIVSALGTTPVNRAKADESGNNIQSTYATKTALQDFIDKIEKYFTFGNDNIKANYGLWTDHYLSAGGQNTNGDIGGITEVTAQMITDALGYTPISPSDKLPNPYALVINGQRYDGSSEVVVDISGGSGTNDWNDIINKPTTLSGYGITDALSTSGGTIEAYDAFPLTIKVSTYSNLLTFITDNNTERTVIGYYASSTRGSEFRNATSGSYIGITDEGTPHYNGNTLYHTGNFNPANYLPLSGGTLTAFDSPLALSSTSARVFQLFKVGTSNKGSIGYANGLMYIGNDTGNYARIGVNDNGIPQYWSDNNAANAQTLIHSGNIGDYAALSYGEIGANSVKGNASGYTYAINGGKVSGGFISAGLSSYGFQLNGDDETDALYYRGYTPNGYNTWKTIAFTDSNVLHAQNLTHSNGIAGATVASNGYILIGTTENRGNRLAVNAFTGPQSLGSIINGVHFGNIGEGYGTYFWTQGSGNGFIQQGRNDGYTDAYNLCVQPLGGNVLIGTTADNGAKLQVNGNISASGDITAGSDVRYKTRLYDVSVDIDTIANAPLFDFKWNDREDDNIHLGTTAQYWAETSFKHAVRPTNNDKLWTMSYGQIAMANTIVIARKVVNHEERIKQLEKEITRLKKEQYEY